MMGKLRLGVLNLVSDTVGGPFRETSLLERHLWVARPANAIWAEGFRIPWNVSVGMVYLRLAWRALASVSRFEVFAEAGGPSSRKALSSVS